jgi:hypothetical protein
MSDLSTILGTDCRGTIVGFDGIELKINSRGWEPGADLDAIIAGKLPATRDVIATQDGRYIDLTGWHEGDASEDEWVFYERYSTRGREGHGWVHRGTRKLLQSG